MTIREPKPNWLEVPENLRRDLARLVGEDIAEAKTVWGGYGPSATFTLTTASGRRYFCKGSHPGQTEQGHQALQAERRNYETMPKIAQFGPAYFGRADHAGWHMALLEHIPRALVVPPWSGDAADRALDLLVRFHAAVPPRAERALSQLAQSDLMRHQQGWRSLMTDRAARGRFIALFAEAPAAERWFARHVAALVALEDAALSTTTPMSWLHMDIRSDNLVFAEDGRIVLVDWPMLTFGAVLFDIAAFLPSLEGEGGPSCADALRRYESLAGLTFDPRDVAKAVADVAGFFAARAGEPPIAALPRLRWVQKLQLFPALNWLSGCLGIDPPPVPRANEL